MSFYNVVLFGFSGGNQIQNAFQYDTSSLLPSMGEAVAISNMFTDATKGVLPVLKPVIHSSTSWNSLYVTAPYTPDVFSLALYGPGTQVGAVAGESLPRFNAWGFRQPRGRRDMNDGAKRFGVVAESQQSGGAPLAGTLTQLAALATRMSQVNELFYDGITTSVTPIIVKRVKYETAPGKFAYRIPQAGDPYIFYAATQWTFDEMTTQNTRKTGRGA